MSKIVGQAAAPAPNGAVTIYTRNTQVTAYVINNNIFDDQAIVKESSIVQPLVYTHGYDEAGGPGPIIRQGEIPMTKKIILDIFMSQVYNYLFPHLEDEVAAYNEGKTLADQRSLWTKAENPGTLAGRRPFYDLKIGSDVAYIEDGCWTDANLVGPITRFSGGSISIGANAFERYGNISHQFQNMKQLEIKDKSFYEANCGEGITLIDCILTNATYAFSKANLKEKDFVIINGKGPIIASRFAEGAKIDLIYIEMEEEQYNIGDRAFKGCDAKLLQIVGGCEEIFTRAFQDNDFKHGISPFPDSITDYHLQSFEGSNIKSLEFGATQATFHQESFANNKIEVGFQVNGLFKISCFNSAIKGDSPSDTFIVNGIIGEKLAFANNYMPNIACQATVNADGSFYNSVSDNISIGGNINARHTFLLEGAKQKNITVQNLSNLDNSFRTFQEQELPYTDPAFGQVVTPDPPAPCSAIVYFLRSTAEDLGQNTSRFGWNSRRDKFAYSREEAIAFSEDNPDLYLEWIHCAPRSITVGLGSGESYWEETLTLDEAATIPGTNSTIFPLPSYFKQVDNGIDFDQWTVQVEYQPWGLEKIMIMGDPELTDAIAPGYDSQGYSTAGSQLLTEGVGFWEINATRAAGPSEDAEGIGFARTSRCIIEGDLNDPTSDDNISINTDAHPSEAGTFVSFLPSLYAGHSLELKANLATRAQKPHLQQLGEYIVNGNVFSFPAFGSKLYVPADQVDFLNNSAHFRNKHMFDGEILAITE